MTAALNGQAVETPASDDLRTEVAKALHAACAGEDDTWDGMSDEERGEFLTLADHAIETHVRGLFARSFRIIPPGSVASPSSPEEAAAMVQAAKNFMTSQKRKQGLLAAPARKLIVPGVH